MASPVPNDCSFVGEFGSCHQTIWTNGKTGLMPLSALTEEDRKLILWRSDSKNIHEQTADICMHHQKALLSKYSVRQIRCCDPYNRHQRPVKSSLRTVTEAFATKIKAKPGQKVCPSCVKISDTYDTSDQHMTEGSATDEFSPDIEDKEDINESIVPLGVSPVKAHSIPQHSRLSYAKRKVKKIERTITSKLAKTLQVPPEEILSTSQAEDCTGCSDLIQLIQELKLKCELSSRQEKVKLLTLAPSSWSIEKTALEFKVSQYLVRKARHLKSEAGILADPSSIKGKALEPAVIEAVKSFYEDDEYSRMCPGKKDFVSVKSETGRIHKQKRLLLINLKELYALFKKKFPELKVGFSKFCELRPAWCATVDSKSALSVCVCEIHQNLKLLVGVLPGRLDYKELLSHLVCDIDSRACMLHQCEQCPGKEALTEFLKTCFEQADTDMDDNIQYKQWAHGGQCKLQTHVSSVQDFVDILTKTAEASTIHHYTAKAQAANLRQLKETLPTDSAVVLLDFAENYSFVCQDAVQSFHWDTAQATLHPFVIYHRENEDGDLKCFNLCVISDDKKHNAFTVHYFIKLMMKQLKELKPNLRKVYYYSDGAASQYKNCKNMRNLCFHEEDFGVEAEWHFFATSHGKSPCDGIGGTVKRLAARASLHATTRGHILTPAELFNFATTNIAGINFVFAKTDDVQAHEQSLNSRMSNILTVIGTRSHHRFVPLGKHAVQMYRLSQDEVHTRMSVSSEDQPDEPQVLTQNNDLFQCGKYVAAVYSDEWYIGVITDRSTENQDVLLSFMRRNKRTQALTWGSNENCWVPFANILRVVPSPDVTGRTARQYRLDKSILQDCDALFASFKSQ